MNKPFSSVGLAIIGPCRTAAHLAVLKEEKEVNIVGLSVEGASFAPSVPDTLLFADHQEALGHPEVRGVVICTPLHEREYWVSQAILAEKHVFCCSPIAPTCRQARKLVAFCRQRGIHLAVEMDVFFSPLGNEIRRMAEKQKIGPLVFFDLKVFCPKQWLGEEREGVLLLHGIKYLNLIRKCFGDIDSIYARTRSVGLNRLAEDVMVAQLRFKDGLEGVVVVNGLGDREGVGMELYGRTGTADWKGDRLDTFPEGLRFQYRDFTRTLRHGGKPIFGGEEGVEGLFCVEWIQQSARQEREIFRKEVKIE